MTAEDDFGEEGARPSSLIPVHKLSTRDPLHDMQLLRDVAIINERVRRELGPPRNTPPQPKPDKERENMKPRELAMATLVAVGEIARHHVPREEVLDLPDGELTIDPLILLEINDRTIRVYMRTYIPTKHFQIQGNPYSNSRSELILAKTYQY